MIFGNSMSLPECFFLSRENISYGIGSVLDSSMYIYEERIAEWV